MAVNPMLAALMKQLGPAPKPVEPKITTCFNCGATIDLNKDHDCWKDRWS